MSRPLVLKVADMISFTFAPQLFVKMSKGLHEFDNWFMIGWKWKCARDGLSYNFALVAIFQQYFENCSSLGLLLLKVI